MWDLIVLVPDYCLFVYFTQDNFFNSDCSGIENICSTSVFVRTVNCIP